MTLLSSCVVKCVGEILANRETLADFSEAKISPSVFFLSEVICLRSVAYDMNSFDGRLGFSKGIQLPLGFS